MYPKGILTCRTDKVKESHKDSRHKDLFESESDSSKHEKDAHHDETYARTEMDVSCRNDGADPFAEQDPK